MLEPLSYIIIITSVFMASIAMVHIRTNVCHDPKKNLNKEHRMIIDNHHKITRPASETGETLSINALPGNHAEAENHDIPRKEDNKDYSDAVKALNERIKTSTSHLDEMIGDILLGKKEESKRQENVDQDRKARQSDQSRPRIRPENIPRPRSKIDDSRPDNKAKEDIESRNKDEHKDIESNDDLESLVSLYSKRIDDKKLRS